MYRVNRMASWINRVSDFASCNVRVRMMTRHNDSVKGEKHQFSTIQDAEKKTGSF